MSKTIVITGGTGGIGLQTATGLAATGARIVVTGRNAERGELAVTQIRADSGNDAVELVTGDLSTKAGVAALAEALMAKVDRIDVLINNAGMMAQQRTVNEDGVELNFAVNVVAPYRLTHALLEPLKAGSPARVLVLTGGKASGPFNPSDLQSEQSFVPLVNYTMTKRAEEAMALVMAKELEPLGIFVTIVYPGRASTAMTQAMTPASLPWFMRPAWPIFRMLIPSDDGGKSAKSAAQSSIFAATTPSLHGKAGLYINKDQHVDKLHATVHSPGNQALVMRAIAAV